MLRNFGFVGICFILLFAGCSSERNLARKYVKNHTGSGIMIVPLYEIYKDNLTISYDTSAQYSSEELDSIAWVQAVFVPYISDSVFLTGFTNSLIGELSKIGYDVYLDGSSDIFLSLPDPKWIVQIAQLELKEDHRIDYYEMYSIEDGEPYYEGYRINQVNLSSWFEVSRANTGNKQVLYLEGYIQDDFNIGVDLDLMEFSVGLIGNRDSLEVKDLYNMAEQSGAKHAELLFDYFMNDYIREHLPSGIINRQYFHYNTRTKSLKRGLTERFDVVN
jgi:hypothetical protein